MTDATGVDPAGDVDALRARLDAAADERGDAREAVAEYGRDTLEAVASLLDRAEALLDRYEGSATGSGDFQAFVAFQGEVDDLADDVPDDLPAADAFAAYDDVLDQRRVSERDFDRAREALAPARELAGRLDDLRDARETFREARRDAVARLDEVEDHIEDLQRLVSLADADLDAPTERLRDPIEAYDDAVKSAFRAFRHDAPAQEVFGVADAAGAFPLVEVRTPPDDLRAYVTRALPDATVEDLLEYADYSRSKLEHYVDEPATLKRTVGANRTYLERLDASPLTVDWPPPRRRVLRYRTRELVSVVGRFAPESVVARLRDVRALTRREDYDRLRRTAVAEAELTDAERERVASGEAERDLVAARAERDALRDLLDEYESL